MTTGGAVLLAFYAENNDVIIWAWNLMGFPSVMYIIINTNEQAPRFPSISGLTIGRDTKIIRFHQKYGLSISKFSISEFEFVISFKRSCKWTLRCLSRNIFNIQVHV